jgi:hypothetical protein
MNRYINDAIALRGTSTIENAPFMLQAAKVNKVTLDDLVARLNDNSMFTNAVLALVDMGSIASGVTLRNALSDVYSRFDDMFDTANSVSLIFDNNAMLLSSEIKRLESELTSLQKSVDNYSFLLSDSNAYDSVFVDDFSDTVNFAEFDFSIFQFLTDRSGIDFQPSERAQVLTDEGVLAMSPSTNIDYQSTAKIWASNCAGMFFPSNKNNAIDNITEYDNLMGWRSVVESSSIINSPLVYFENLNEPNSLLGAQFIIEVSVTEEKPIDTLVIDPFTDYPFELVQVIGFTSASDSEGKKLLLKPLTIDVTKNIFFEKDSYQRFHLYLNQKIYTRKANSTYKPEAAAENRSAQLLEAQSRQSDVTVSLGEGVIDLQPYWRKVLENLGESLGQRDSELLKSGLPSYWSLSSGFVNLELEERENGDLLNRSVKLESVNDSYLQNMMTRFFGTQNGGIGSYFRSLIERSHGGNPQLNPQFNSNNVSMLRLSPYSRVGDDESIFNVPISDTSKNYYTEISESDVSSSDSWSAKADWQSWPGGVVGGTIDGNVTNRRVWSESRGVWLEGPSDSFSADTLYPGGGGYIKDAASAEILDAIDPDDTPSPGGTDLYIPTLRYNEAFYAPRSPYTYKYVLGIRSMKLKLSGHKQRSIYVSRIIGTPGDISALKLKESSDNFLYKDNLDTESLTSVEYSVTNQPDIWKEESWTPILPVDKDIVRGERLFPDSNGVSVFRFPVSDGTVSFFKNGKAFDAIKLGANLLRRPGNSTVYGINFPLTAYSSTDILTCDYVPSGDNHVISFDNFSNKVNLSTSYADEDGPGQAFVGDSKVEYQLQYSPYVDYDSVKARGSEYAPISIIFQDGSTPSNLTNYLSKEKVSLDSSSLQYSFLQSGNIIIFNKPVTQEFRVYYSYFPSNFRVRVILRSNYIEPISPKVDYYQVKTQTRKPDAKRD